MTTIEMIAIIEGIIIIILFYYIISEHYRAYKEWKSSDEKCPLCEMENKK